MSDIGHDIAYRTLHRSSKCVVRIDDPGADGGVLNIYLDLDYEIAVYKYLEDEKPLSIQWSGDPVRIGTFSASRIISIGRLQ